MSQISLLRRATDRNSNPSFMGWAILAYATKVITPPPSCDCHWLKAVYQSLTSVQREHSSILCLQVRDFLHPKGGRKAPQHWWCKPPAMPAQQAPTAVPQRTLAPSKRKAAAVTTSQPPKDKSAKAAKLESDVAAAATPADGDATAGLDGAAAADQPAAGAAARSQQKRKLSTAKTKSAKHMPLTDTNSQPQRQMPGPAAHSTATEHATAMADLAAPSTELEPVTLPAIAHPALPGASRQNKAAAPRKVSGQGLGGVSAFSARALSDLMEDGPLLEALQDLLTAMHVPSAIAPATANRGAAAATLNLADSKAKQVDINSNAAAGQEPAGPVAALVDGAATIPAAASHAQQGSMAGVSLVSSELPQASVKPVKAEGGSHAGAAAAAAAAAGRAGGQLGRQESKRLRGKAAALAKALGLNTAGVVQHCFTASNVDVQEGQSEGEGMFWC